MSLSAEHLHFDYRDRNILCNVSLALNKGELVCLMGINGAGKSTLLKILLGLQQPKKGLVQLNGKAINTWKRKQFAQHVAYVPQVHVAPFPYTVQQVALLGRLSSSRLFSTPSSTDLGFIHNILEQLGISHLADRSYTEISGGERQLTLIARALAQQAQLLIMDEPLAGLDYGNQVRLLSRLKRLAAQGYGILMTTHDPNHHLSDDQRVILLHEGTILADGLASTVLTPHNIYHLYGIHVELARTADGSSFALTPTAQHPSHTL